jgi:hypothetical protein
VCGVREDTTMPTLFAMVAILLLQIAAADRGALKFSSRRDVAKCENCVRLGETENLNEKEEVQQGHSFSFEVTIFCELDLCLFFMNAEIVRWNTIEFIFCEKFCPFAKTTTKNTTNKKTTQSFIRISHASNPKWIKRDTCIFPFASLPLQSHQ